ncbi:CerR family C-terminal domain-containing protein [Frateuria aurantia]
MASPPRAARTSRIDGEATRTRILSAATERFATTGFAETTSKAIAQQAGVDLASINYHFGSRNGLYQAVLIQAHHHLVVFEDLRRVAESEQPPAEKLRFLIEHVVRRAVAEPPSPHLQVLARELMAPTSHLQVLFQDVALPKMLLITRILSEITAIPAEDPALTRCLISIGAPCMMLLVGARFPGPMQEILQMPPEAIAEHLARFASGGLEAIAQQYRQQPQP